MKISPLLKNTARITAPVLLALLLAITILPGAAFATPTETDPNVPGTGGGH